MEGYTSYQHLQLGWTDILPSHWGVKRLKRVLSERKENNNPVKTNEILSLTNTRGVIPYSEKGNIGNKSKENIEGYHLTYPNDLVVNSMNVVIGSVGVSDYFGAISPVYYALMSRGEANIKYYEYIFRLPSFEETLKGLGNGILEIRMRIPMSKLNNVLLPLPPRVEQDQIVRFLDWKVSEINKLISIRRKEIQELEGLKKVIVHKAITGKNCDTATRDTSIEWIGAIPAEWEIRHVKNVAIITNGSDPKTEGNIPVYGSGDGSFKTCGEYKEGPAVLIGRKGTINIPHYVEGKYWNVDTAFDVHMKDDNDLRWFYYLAQCFDYQFYISQTTLPSMTQTDYNNMSIPVPSVPVQHEIASYLDRESLKIDKAIDLTERKIDALTEMKNTLISDVVTGKIDVRNVTVPEYEHVDDIYDDNNEDGEETEETETVGEEA
jgi:type I restriction enzyme S subunit